MHPKYSPAHRAAICIMTQALLDEQDGWQWSSFLSNWGLEGIWLPSMPLSSSCGLPQVCQPVLFRTLQRWVSVLNTNGFGFCCCCCFFRNIHNFLFYKWYTGTDRKSRTHKGSRWTNKEDITKSFLLLFQFGTEGPKVILFFQIPGSHNSARLYTCLCRLDGWTKLFCHPTFLKSLTCWGTCSWQLLYLLPQSLVPPPLCLSEGLINWERKGETRFSLLCAAWLSSFHPPCWLLNTSLPPQLADPLCLSLPPSFPHNR